MLTKVNNSYRSHSVSFKTHLALTCNTEELLLDTYFIKYVTYEVITFWYYILTFCPIVFYLKLLNIAVRKYFGDHWNKKQYGFC